MAVSDDLISRADVIAILGMNKESEYKKSMSAEVAHKSVIRSKHDSHVAFCDYLINAIEKLPSIQPRKGKWIKDGAGYIICSECNWFAPTIEVGCLANRHMEQQESDFLTWLNMEYVPDTNDGELYCDQCEQEHPEQKIIWNFCPNCGSYNGGEQDEP